MERSKSAKRVVDASLIDEELDSVDGVGFSRFLSNPKKEEEEQDNDDFVGVEEEFDKKMFGEELSEEETKED